MSDPRFVSPEWTDDEDGWLVEPLESSKSEYRNATRILHLLHLLLEHSCSRRDIFETLADDYQLDEASLLEGGSALARATKMLNRDLKFLQNVGYEIHKVQEDNRMISYRLGEERRAIMPSLFSKEELDVLALLHNLFANPAKYASLPPSQSLPTMNANNPFAEQVTALIERLIKTLPSKRLRYFQDRVRKPFVYFNLDVVTNYLPHRDTIEKLEQAMIQRRQIRFDYLSSGSTHSTPHHRVDPYYIFQYEGHFYLLGFNCEENTRKNRFYEYRIDRIQTETIKLLSSPINTFRRQRPIEFEYWAYESLASGEVSQRWLTQEVVREETFMEDGKQRRRRLIRATAYGEWRILQQLHRYGDKVELVAPLHLRQRMAQEVKRLYDRYYHCDNQG